MKTVHNPLLKEASHHSVGSFPANYYMMMVRDMHQILPTHWHDEWEFFFVASGRCVLALNNARFTMETGDMALVPAGQVHAAFAVDRGPCNYNALVFHSRLLEGPDYDVISQQYITPMSEGLMDLPVKLSRATPWQASVMDNVLMAYELLQKQPAAFELRIKACIFSAFAEICANCPQKGQVLVSPEYLDYRADRMNSIYHFIHSNCRSKLTVQTLARVANMSPGYLCRFFKDMTGRTITEYINHYRVSQAAIMIESTDKKLLEIALDTGFNNLSYFVNQFKRCFGVTPSEFKKTQRRYGAKVVHSDEEAQ